jgi:hypothetical protein
VTHGDGILLRSGFRGRRPMLSLQPIVSANT